MLNGKVVEKDIVLVAEYGGNIRASALFRPFECHTPVAVENRYHTRGLRREEFLEGCSLEVADRTIVADTAGSFSGRPELRLDEERLGSDGGETLVDLVF